MGVGRNGAEILFVSKFCVVARHHTLSTYGDYTGNNKSSERWCGDSCYQEVVLGDILLDASLDYIDYKSPHVTLAMPNDVQVLKRVQLKLGR